MRRRRRKMNVGCERERTESVLISYLETRFTRPCIDGDMCTSKFNIIIATYA